MTTYKNAYELAEKRKKKDDFATALSEMNDYGINNKNQSNLVDSFSSGYAQGSSNNNGFSMLGQSLAGLGSSQSDKEDGGLNFGNMLMNGLSKLSSSGSTNSVPTQYQFGNLNKPLFGSYDLGGTNAGVGSLGSTSTSGSSGFLSNLKGGSSSGGGTPWALIGSLAKGGYNSISGKDDKDYSDVEESVMYPLQGASMGSMFGPWGAAGGALYGLGYSFKDDLGLKDNNFLTQMLLPIGMGDGGGLRIGGKSILDLG